MRCNENALPESKLHALQLVLAPDRNLKNVTARCSQWTIAEPAGASSRSMRNTILTVFRPQPVITFST
eukprot:4424992-Lingulodinium_polyedra.AAC.1